MPLQPKPIRELQDIEVQRLDAVDSPASRRRWLILKSDTPEVEKMDPQALEKAALALCESLKADAADNGLAMSEASLAALNGVAKTLGLSDQFSGKPADEGATDEQQKAEKEAAEKAAQEQAAKDEGGTDAGASEGATAAAATSEPATKGEVAAIAKSLTALSEKIDKVAVAKSETTAPPSKQERGQEVVTKSAPKEMGKGLFTNVVFG